MFYMNDKLQKILSRIIGRELKPTFGIRDFLKYFGPGLLVTVGFIDPGNWATNISAGSDYGYSLLWILSLSTLMLIILQHNVAHLGIASGLCLSEAATIHLPHSISRPVLGSAMIASISTSFAEILGGAIALRMLFNIPLRIGAIMVVAAVMIVLFTNSYRKLERWIIGFVSIIGFAFLYELFLVDIDWPKAFIATVTPEIPLGSMTVIMGVLGAVVMPHNLFLHSEIIQSRQWNLQDEKIIKKQLDYEFLDTLFAMLIGFAINAAIILLAATSFFVKDIRVSELEQAQNLLTPLLGNGAGTVFAFALLCAAFASTITSALAGGSIFAGVFKEPFNIQDRHSRYGIYISLFIALGLIFVVTNPFQGLIYSQVLLSMQLPVTIFLQIYLTSSKKVMGHFVNKTLMKTSLGLLAIVVSALNLKLLWDFFHNFPQ